MPNYHIKQLTDFLSYSAAQVPDKTALIYDNKKYTFKDIMQRSNAAANCLAAQGIKRGDRVLVHLGNCLETIISFWAILKVDAIASIIDINLKQNKLDYIIKDSGAKVVITDKPLVIRDLNSKGLLRIIITLTEILDTEWVDNTKLVSFNKIFGEYECNYAPISRSIDLDLASIIYTSGSTGEPKGVMLTHRNMIAATQSINSYLENTSDDKIISALPLSFDYGLYQFILATAVGATLILEKNFLLPSQFLRKIEREKATALPGVPTFFALLFEHFKRTNFDLSSIRYITNTGAALSPTIIERMQDMFPQARTFSMYGLTECKRCTYLPPDDLKRKSNSIGFAIPNTELWLVDENDQKVAPHQIGQLVIRGATVMSGYWNKPEETAKKLRNGRLPFEKVLYTGDYCSFDEEGYLYFHGRMDEVVKIKGIKISPKEVEDVIATFPGIEDVAVIALDDVDCGYVLAAYVTTNNSNMKLATDDLLNYCRNNLENFKCPKSIHVIPTMPRSTNGKINKHALKQISDKIFIGKENVQY